MTASERIATLFAFFPMGTMLIICGVITALAIVALVFLEKTRHKALVANQHLKEIKVSEEIHISENYDITSSKHIMHDEYITYEKEAKKLTYITPLCFLTAIIMFLSIVTMGSIWTTYTTAQKHGYYKGLEGNAAQIWKHIHKSPIEDQVPEDLHGKLIVYYRFGCPDCSAVYPELTERLKELTDVYWISTRSAQGKELIAKYPVDEVPSVLYVKYDGTYSTAIIYKKNEEKQSYLDKSTLEDFLTMVTYDRRSYTNTN